jgi:hypothetical protein
VSSTTSNFDSPTDRVFCQTDAEQVDEFGFLDRDRTPRIVGFESILRQPIAWILGQPWIGKSTVAGDALAWLRRNPGAFDRVEQRVALCKLGAPGVEREIPPEWWQEWLGDDRLPPAVWLLDGVDEGFDHNAHVFRQIVDTISGVPPDHLRELRLILFSRAHVELGGFQEELDQKYYPILPGLSSHYWLARLDRAAAENMVGAEPFARILDLIRRNKLQAVAGLPVVLQYLARYSELRDLSVRDVWRGILMALLGEPQSNPVARFTTSHNARFMATCQIAAVLSLTRRDFIREHSPDPDALTLGTLFLNPDNPNIEAAQDACRTPVFVQMPEQGAYRFAQRNVQDWFTAFAVEQLPMPALRAALAGADGALVPRLRESARLLRAITSRTEIQGEIDRLSGGVTLPPDAVEPTLAEACRCLDQLETLARNAPWGLRIGYDRPDDLRRLRVDGLGAVLTIRLRDPLRPVQVKRLLIEVAEATEPQSVVDAVLEVVVDVDQDDELRWHAMRFAAQFGGDAHLRKLATSIGEATSTAEIDLRLRGVLIRELLRRGLWPVWRAALYAPAVNRDLLDSRVSVAGALAESMTLGDAKQILPHLRGLYERHADPERSDPMPEFVQKAIDLLADQTPTGPQDIDALADFALQLFDDAPDDTHAWMVVRKIGFQLRSNASVRRRFYVHDVEAGQSGQASRRIGVRELLMPEDWRWLCEQAVGPWAEIRQVWDDAYGLARRARDAGQLESRAWSEFLSLVERHVPGLGSEFEALIEHYQLEHQRREEERKKRENQDPLRQPLSDRIQHILEHVDLGDADRMRALGLLCFGGSVGVDRQATGEWEALPNDTKRRVFDVCRRGLEVGEPTPIPTEGSFPGSVLGEGAAFSQIALSLDQSDWLTESRIEKWLPTALFAGMSGGWTELIRACWSVSQPATDRVLLRSIADQIRRNERPFLLRDIPSECWTEAMTQQIETAVADNEIRPAGGQELLEQMLLRNSKRVGEFAARWASLPVAPGEASHLRRAGRNVLLHLRPAEALDIIESDFATRGIEVLKELVALWAWRDEFHVQWDQWPVSLLERLGRILLQASPMAEDPEYRGGFVTPEREIRQLRDELLSHLLRRTDPESHTALDRLAELDPELRDWLATHRASSDASRFLETANPAAVADPSALTKAEAIAVLNRAGYRLIRSNDDLLDAVTAVLQMIQADINHDLPMLYSAPPRGTKAPAAAENGPNDSLSRRHLEEDALQAYLRRRLQDLMPRFVDGVDVDAVREAQIGYRRRLDLLVTAPCRLSGKLAQLIIEIKWSTNNETRIALVEQLGQNYLLAEGRTHGVFLVGWSGWWRRGDRTSKNSSIADLRQYLTKQRDDFCRPGEPGAGLRIEPFVLDARWQQK